jgi:transcriptional regulator with XRE-family HTH domain
MSAIMDKTTTDEFGWADFIVEEREKHGWSQADLARKVGSTRQTIHNYESRRRADLDIEILSRISKAFGYGSLHLPRMAGLVPGEVQTDTETDDIVEALEDFTKREKQELLAYINFLRNQRKNKR